MSLTKEQVKLLRLEIEKRTRVPPRVRQRLLQAYDAHTDSTERIFLDHGGLPTCAAYLFTKYIAEDVKGRQPQKQVRRKLVKFLDNLSVKDRLAAAGQLKAALEADAAEIEEWVKKSRERALARNRPNTSSDGAGFEQMNGDSGLNEHNCNSISHVMPPPPGTNERTCQTSDHAVSDSQSDSSSKSSQQDVAQGLDRSLYLDEASVSACNLVFPEYLAGAIVRQSKLGDTLAAAVSLTPTQDDRVACLNINVTPKRIENIAQELFNAHLENEAGVRYAYMGHTRLIPTQELVLEWCRLESIPLIFGNILAQAVSSSPVYEKERLGEEERTKCVSMVVSGAVDKCARVEVLLALEQATEIANMLTRTI